MCNVCVAISVLKNEFIYDSVDGVIYVVRATGEGAEFKPCKYQLKRDGEDWSKVWLDTDDLAHTMMQLGFDSGEACMNGRNRKFIMDTYQKCRV